ncbi:hypothetical protein Bpfe_005143 [Biomphalaria pfeifferi]|uniref:Secreted protein n=1 Tax=Biomphalaria pfeifferi TaxID=112525 RepID=A0AAD8C3U1_BIOPF|nr:hypothetical protein Bpfe_005143 [Biomphalaria pfeifferi]
MTSTLGLWFSWLFQATHSILGNITKMIAAEHLNNHRETENFGRIIQNERRDSLHTAIGDHETQESIGGEAGLHKHRGSSVIMEIECHLMTFPWPSAEIDIGLKKKKRPPNTNVIENTSGKVTKKQKCIPLS